MFLAGEGRMFTPSVRGGGGRGGDGRGRHRSPSVDQQMGQPQRRGRQAPRDQARHTPSPGRQEPPAGRDSHRTGKERQSKL